MLNVFLEFYKQWVSLKDLKYSLMELSPQKILEWAEATDIFVFTAEMIYDSLILSMDLWY